MDYRPLISSTNSGYS